MAEFQRVNEVLLRDPLSEASRGERRSLLAVSTIAIGMLWTNLIPQQIAALGIEFSALRKDALLNILACVVLYFMVTFAAHAAPDFVAWQLALRYAQRDRLIRKRKATREQQYDRNAAEQELQHTPGFMMWFRQPKRVARLRVIFDFALPLAVGMVALVALIVA